MASRQLPRRHNFIRPPTPRSRGYTVAPDTIDEILSTCLNWVLPVLFFCVIIILVTMLSTYTLVMGRPLPRAFTFVIVITFSFLITITFFILVAFHIYRCQRVRSMLSEVRLAPPSPASPPSPPPLFKARENDQFMISNLGRQIFRLIANKFRDLGLHRR